MTTPMPRARRPAMTGAGWRRILVRTARRVGRDRVDVIASSAAFWALLALFPTIAAVLAMSAWVLEPGAMRDQISALSAPLPDEAAELLNDSATEVASRDRVAGFGAIIAISFAIWTAAAATKTLMEGLNSAYGETERRGFLRFNAVALLLTFGMFVGFILSVVTIVVVPAALAHQPGLGWTASLVDWLRWPVMAVFAMAGLATLYRFGPSRRNARWRWVSIGAVVATVLWILVSLGFSLYVSEFAAYNRFYGTLGRHGRADDLVLAVGEHRACRAPSSTPRSSSSGGATCPHATRRSGPGCGRSAGRMRGASGEREHGAAPAVVAPCQKTAPVRAGAATPPARRTSPPPGGRTSGCGPGGR
jgi:membrane protein